MEEKDFSKSTVMVLLVLAIIISLLSTWTVYDQLQNSRSPKLAKQASVSEGHIRLEIVSDNPSSNNGAQGHVSLDLTEG